VDTNIVAKSSREILAKVFSNEVAAGYLQLFLLTLIQRIASEKDRAHFSSDCFRCFGKGDVKGKSTP